MSEAVRPVNFVGSALEDLREFPDAVRQDIGYALFQAQSGEKPLSAKPLKGFGGAGVLELVENYDGDTYRAVYTVKFKGVVYVLHCFQKKSRHGVSTPLADIELVKQRLRMAQQDYEENYA